MFAIKQSANSLEEAAKDAAEARDLAAVRLESVTAAQRVAEAAHAESKAGDERCKATNAALKTVSEEFEAMRTSIEGERKKYNEVPFARGHRRQIYLIHYISIIVGCVKTTN